MSETAQPKRRVNGNVGSVRRVLAYRVACLVLVTLSLTACGPSPEETARATLDEAGAADEAGDLGTAERLLVELLEGVGATTDLTDAERLLEEVRGRQEEAVLQTFGQIHEAQADFMARERRYAQFFDALVDGNYLSASPDDGNLGWVIRMRPSPAADSYSLTGEPEIATAAKRFFFSDETGVIRWETGRPATLDSPPLSVPED